MNKFKKFMYCFFALFFLAAVYEYNNYAGACLAGLTLVILLINSTDLFET